MLATSSTSILSKPILPGRRTSDSRRAARAVASSSSASASSEPERHVSTGSAHKDVDDDAGAWRGMNTRRAAAVGAAVALALSANVDAADAKTVNITIDPGTLTSQTCANSRAAGVPGECTKLRDVLTSSLFHAPDTNSILFLLSSSERFLLSSHPVGVDAPVFEEMSVTVYTVYSHYGDARTNGVSVPWRKEQPRIRQCAWRFWARQKIQPRRLCTTRTCTGWGFSFLPRKHRFFFFFFFTFHRDRTG